jgi:hypothetical protein
MRTAVLLFPVGDSQIRDECPDGQCAKPCHAKYKTCTLPQDLIPLLKSRGLAIPDEQKAIGCLKESCALKERNQIK